MLGLDGLRILEVSETSDELLMKVETTATVVGCGQCGTRAVAHDREPITDPVGFTREDLELARAEHPVPTRAWGPRTIEEVRELRAHHQGWP